MVKLELRDASYRCGDARCAASKLSALGSIRLDDPYWPDLCALLAFVIAFRAIAFLGLKYNT